MNAQSDRRIHAILDGKIDPATTTVEEARAVASYRHALERLEKARVRAPVSLTRRILTALPVSRRSFREWVAEILSQRPAWVVPSFAGAMAMLLLMLGIRFLTPSAQPERIRVQFQISAPGAQRVDLLGDFNRWTPGAIRLRGPNASGLWTADVELPEGRYEYQFLVDGKVWVTDPNAATHRPDGFGHENAVLDVCEGRG